MHGMGFRASELVLGSNCIDFLCLGFTLDCTEGLEILGLGVAEVKNISARVQKLADFGRHAPCLTS